MFTSMTSWRPPPGPKEVECASLGGSSCTSQPCTPPSSSECSEGEPSLQGPRPRESPGVRAKAAFFEALIKSNTTALKHAELAAEYHRMQRIADLSRTVSKENLAKTSKTLKALRQVQQELYATKKRTQALEERNRKIKDENLALREKVGLLERYDFEHVQQSVCMRHYTRCRVAETY
ncbi:hypothetical protein APUTEX25_002832 [Auxenochlorella protothecoides]|uniref:Uncharacterized protein n=1 Tax=Auxenochlorella protothecoides TaxID=3075 RepID=A0A3M7L1U7_AUXPR|nr:hypothetical protein APUTEX25_002832 [Auxenochlorella protothecoides]|eukprot:RMZ56743.1 hypothetical protein APUTEX25_002832 [Auxenochlorella protothecoides]